MDNNERREILKQALAEINASLLSNSQMLDKALLSLSSAGLGVSLAFIDVHIQLSKRAAAEGMSLSELVASILDQATDDSR